MLCVCNNNCYQYCAIKYHNFFCLSDYNLGSIRQHFPSLCSLQPLVSTVLFSEWDQLFMREWQHELFVFPCLCDVTSCNNLHIVANNRVSSFVRAKWHSVVCMYHVHFIHSPDDQYLTVCIFLVIVNSIILQSLLAQSRTKRFQNFGLVLGLFLERWVAKGPKLL